MKQVRHVLRNYFEAIHPGLAEEVNSIEQLPLRQLVDSFGMLDLLCFLEEQFEIVILDDEVIPEHFENINSIVRFVEKKAE